MTQAGTLYSGGHVLRSDQKRCAWLLAASLFLGDGAVLANGRFPATNAVVSQPGNPKSIALRATYGLLLSKDEGAIWDWVCESAIGYSGNEDPSLVLTASGAIVVGAFNGTSRSIDGGCHWSRDVTWPTSVIDLTVRPNTPNRIYAVTSAFSKMSDAGENLYASGLFVSEDAGAHWTSRTAFDPSLLIDSVEVAPNDPSRAYVSAARYSDHEVIGVVLASDDDGAHWKEHHVALIAGEHGIYVAAVDPKNAARLYLRSAGVDTSRLLVSDDGALTVREIARGALFQGFALADDGATIFAGDKNGLQRAASKDDRFDHVSTASIQCLTSIGATLWACVPTTTGYVLGASGDHGATFASKLKLDGMRGPLRCTAPSAMDICAADWSALQSLINPNASASTTDASVTRSSTATPSNKIIRHSRARFAKQKKRMVRRSRHLRSAPSRFSHVDGPR